MRKFVGACAFGLALTLSAGGGAQAQPAAVTAAIADSSRPPADVIRDAKRKPAAMIAFAGMKPGMKVVELIPGGGYFTRIFAKAVGPTGKVYAAAGPGRDGGPPAVAAIAAAPGYENVTVIPLANGVFTAPEPVDIVWTSRNFHDLHNPKRNVDVKAFDKAVLDALKPGGVFVVVDHAAAKGSSIDTTDTLHRIDPELVKKELTAAGFQYAGESKVLRNPDDDMTKKIFDATAPDTTNQFVLKFRKPK
jgi:predicted methyltransferase